MSLSVHVVIPTYNRASMVRRAVEAVFDQSYDDRVVTVVDDGSTDDTRSALEPFFERPDFAYARLASNVGTARAKNVGLALLGAADACDAVTFHDSDDLPDRHKLLRQARALEQRAETPPHFFDWAELDIDPDAPLEVDVALGRHTFIRLDGSTHEIGNRATLFDDFFPSAQWPSTCEGDWILINSGLFRRRLFDRLGGYLDSVEEDRELRNRLLASGAVVYFVEEPLLTKIEMPVSLTVDAETGYRGAERERSRKVVWERLAAVRRGCWGQAAVDRFAEPVDLTGIEIAELSNPRLSRWNETLLATPESRQVVERAHSRRAPVARTRRPRLAEVTR